MNDSEVLPASDARDSMNMQQQNTASGMLFLNLSPILRRPVCVNIYWMIPHPAVAAAAVTKVFKLIILLI